MPRITELFPVVLFALALSVTSTAQVSATTRVSSNAADHAEFLSETGHCSEALPILSTTVARLTDKKSQKRAGLDGVRCATLLQRWDSLLDFVRILDTQFPHDPEVLYVTVHAYSDLSSQAARQLAETAPNSIPALEMDAEANELQGKWELAEKDYRKILEENPRYPGIHFRLARLLLSKPNPPADFQEQAKKELQQELEIDPTNAGAEYILGELALQARDFDEAIRHLTKSTRLDPNFPDAYLGLGVSLSAEKKYSEAIAPLEMAVKLQPSNPAAHYSLGTAYARTGRKADAEREFSLQEAAEHTAEGQQNPQ
jgi:tetratricopeptide (TPR) repeat protein